MTNRSVLPIITILLLFLTLISCKYNKLKSDEESDGLTKNERSSLADSKIAKLFTENEDKYPQSDLKLLENKDFKERLKLLTGDDYDEIMENFDTETPIVSDNEVYKFTGCKAHNCPSFLTTVLYDAKTDNMNVVVSKLGKVKIYEEDGKITTTKALRVK